MQKLTEDNNTSHKWIIGTCIFAVLFMIMSGLYVFVYIPHKVEQRITKEIGRVDSAFSKIQRWSNEHHYKEKFDSALNRIKNDSVLIKRINNPFKKHSL
jgi:hypothetical protein